MHILLRISEVLTLIFGYLPQNGDKYHCALVCRTWSGAALEELWKRLDKFYPLFQLLGGIKFTTEGWVRKFKHCYYQVMLRLSPFELGSAAKHI
jgi:hypothetical protein